MGQSFQGIPMPYFSGFGKKKADCAFRYANREAFGQGTCRHFLRMKLGTTSKKHILKGVLVSIVSRWNLVFSFSRYSLRIKGSLMRFGWKQTSVYAGLVFFSILYAPIELVLSIAMNVVSRKSMNDEADAFAADTIGSSRTVSQRAENLVCF